MNIFLLIGQSNMAGRGRLDEVPALDDPRVQMFRDVGWTQAVEPLHTDKAIAGVGLAMSFACELVRGGDLDPIGLVPCAVGGTPLSRWMPGGDLYENAVVIAKSAMESGSLAGILWHQGEHDSCHPDTAGNYGVRLEQTVQGLRSDLSAANVPFVAGELGPFLRDREECDHFEKVNSDIRGLEARLPAYGCVSADGLGDNGDLLHFNASSLRAFGVRYAARFRELNT